MSVLSQQQYNVSCQSRFLLWPVPCLDVYTVQFSPVVDDCRVKRQCD